MLTQLEKTLNIPLVWLVPRVRLVGENVNAGHLTNHLENPRGILTALLADTEQTMISSQMKLNTLKFSFTGAILTSISLAMLEML
jgi:hypothetical protein